MEAIQKGRHALLPGHLTMNELAEWLIQSAIDRFTDKAKRVFSPEELQEFEHESSVNGREMNRLSDLLDACTAHVKKGGEEPFVVTFPATKGQKKLDVFRRQNDDLIEAGFELEEKEIFGIPSPDTETMEYFDIEGNIIADRSRPLSAKEKHTHLGMFQKSGSRLFIPNQGGSNTGNVDEETGEELTGTNN